MPGISVADLLTALRRRWWLVLLVAVPVVLAAQRYAQSLPDEYESFAVVSLTLEPEADVSSDLIRLEVQRYAVTLASPESTSSLAAELFLPPEQVEDSVEITTPPDTGNIRIGVTGDGPDQPARIANRLAARGVAEALEDPTLRAVVSAQAVPARDPSGPARSMLVAVGVFLGVLAGAGLVLVGERLRPRVHDLGTVARHVGGHHVLGSAALAPGGRVPRRSADDVAAAVRRVEGLASRASSAVVAVVGSTGAAGTRELVSGFAHRPGAGDGRADAADGRGSSTQRLTAAPDGAPSAVLRAAARLQPFSVHDGGDVSSDTAHRCLADADAVVLLVRRGSALRALHRAVQLLDERGVAVLGVWLTTPLRGPDAGASFVQEDDDPGEAAVPPPAAVRAQQG